MLGSLLFRCRLLGGSALGSGNSWFECTQCGYQFGGKLGMVCIVRMNFRHRWHLGTRLIRLCSGDPVHAGIQRSGHGRFVGAGMLRSGDFRGRRHFVRTWLKYHMRHLRLGIAITHLDELRGKRICAGQLRLSDIELAHDVVDHLDRLAEQVNAIRRQRQIGCTHALEQPFQRRKQLRQQRDIDHCDGAMQCVHGTQQLFADRQLVAAALDCGTNGLKVLRDLTAQDLQQYRINRRHH